MTKLALILLIAIVCVPLAGQGQTVKSVRHYKDVRNIIWFTPSATSKINGIAIGLIARSKKQQTINGINTELSFICPFLIVPELAQTISLPLARYYGKAGADHDDRMNDFFSGNKDSVREFINGLSLSMGTIQAERQVKGVSLSIAANYYTAHNGLSFSAYANWVKDYKGLLIAPFGNVSKKGSGLQVGLVNTCMNCSGLQIGLLNQNGRKITPFFGFRSRKKAAMVAKEIGEQCLEAR